MDDNIDPVDWEEDINDILSDTFEEEDQPTTLTDLTDAKLHPLQTLYIEYIDDLPEYPKTHINGHTYIIAADKMSQSEAEQRVQDPSLRLLYHTYLDEKAWQEIQTIRKDIDLVENDIRKRNAFSLYRSKKRFFNSGKACIENLSSCAPVFRKSFYPDINNKHHPYISCINSAPGPLQKHYHSSLKGHTSIDLEFLERLFNESILPSQEECAVIEPLTTRRKFCVNIQETPYILFTSHGIHQHPPPPPHKPPEQILKGIESIIRNMRNPSLTLVTNYSIAKFLRSPELEAFCQQYNASTPAEIHASLSNIDRISAIIQKQRLLTYPEGQDFNGVVYISNINPTLKQYIQEKYRDPDGIMILCAYKEQIMLLNKLTSFEVDMSYKRIRQKNMNEVVFATYLHEHGKSQPVEFNSIHGNGISGIIVDMDTKQYAGVWSRMASLVDCKSEEDYDQLCDLLAAYEDPKIQNWALHKKNAVIKAGLNKNCSRIPSSLYDSIWNHTNSAEQSHHKANAGGKQLSLIEAVQNSAKLDKQDIIQYQNRDYFGVHHSYRTANMEANYLRHLAREESRKRRRSSSAHLSSRSGRHLLQKAL
ncbi:hypothetical protein AN6691.2 [Aspergillus nidulans FGSC A4]|uniref:Uncharacterized protein n=1 Tax=Emericella nidulans (strain FGSC A4 / ATCC 38163 / CBS 112.46 / NRRL 194 / M139) TaxID=227321 RepID=Q5AYD9_EMENI|nr:hypothetical protein [Aspergillus nidulans FGSC A4]EAA58509.1 hypothetical protein AN6691.2 [Aspergillus nidulans FGSC A4]CBF71257.1 TPA: conserved hypothetical protein [Aspergillus nidulans FGSC A4]|eukprot:XP_664295.1 hypothetical protein AN6691.2 [Aspergillus nidulans FGSC A4]